MRIDIRTALVAVPEEGQENAASPADALKAKEAQLDKYIGKFVAMNLD